VIDGSVFIEYHHLRDEYRFSRETNMGSSDKAELFSRLHELRTRQGKAWKEIANILEKEGYEEDGKALTDNALRKRYAKWSKTETRGTSPVASESMPKQGRGEPDLDRFQRSRMESPLKQFEEGAAPPAVSENAIASGIASLLTLNNQLLEQIHQSHRVIERLEKLLGEQDHRTSTTDTEQPVTSRDLLELLKEFGRSQQMKFIEENKEYDVSRQEVQELIDGLVEQKVESELKAMLAEGGSFPTALTHLIDRRLKTLFSPAESVPTTPHAGPGRGKRGKTHKKFSASLEESLFERVKSLPGQFSRHLSNALEAYLAVVGERKTG
jgi:hypothetical protein